MSKLLTVSELAEKLKMTRQSIYQLRAAHQIPYIKIGGSIRFDEELIDEWIKSNRVEVKK